MTTDADKAYKEGYARVFGNRSPEKGRWVYDREQGKFVRPEEFTRPQSEGPMLMKPLDEFVSPVDGSVISDRAQLRRHNKQHGVTNLADFGENDGKSFFERKQAERERILRGDTAQAKSERVETIKRALHEHGKH